jgi:AcrR family transcriptional regulator
VGADPYGDSESHGDSESQSTTNVRILNAAARLFYRRGIRAVSVDEVAAEASVTKVTVYKHFRAKDELLAACLHALDTRFFSWFRREVEASSDDPGERLLAVFDVLDRWFRRRDFRGCAFINATVELANPDHVARGAVLAHKTRCREYFRALAEAAGLADADAISDQWMLLTEGATITALVEGDLGAARKARVGAAAVLRGLRAAA